MRWKISQRDGRWYASCDTEEHDFDTCAEAWDFAVARLTTMEPTA
jgi:hypothetical protein